MYRCIDREDYEIIDWSSIATEGDVGYLLEVDLECPGAIHDMTKWLPLAPENKPITLGMYTEHMRELLEQRNRDRSQGDLFAAYSDQAVRYLFGQEQLCCTF